MSRYRIAPPLELVACAYSGKHRALAGADLTHLHLRPVPSWRAWHIEALADAGEEA